MSASPRLVPPPEPPDLEERIRDGLRRYVAPLEPVLLGQGEGRARSWPAPHGPDPVVFGHPDGPLEAGEPGGWSPVGCEWHDVGWNGLDGCWCCAAGMPALTDY